MPEPDKNLLEAAQEGFFADDPFGDTVDEDYKARRVEAAIDASPVRQVLRAREIRKAQAEAQAGRTEKGTAGKVAADVAGGISELPVQAAGGFFTGVVEFGQTVEQLGDFLRQETVIGTIEQALGLGKVQVRLPQVPEAKTVTGGLIRSTSQFLVGFFPGLKVAKGLGITGQIAKGAVAGAIADVAVFDPSEPRVSNLLNELAPELRNPVTEFLAASPDDTEAEGRLKNAIEGLGLGALADGVLLSARTMRQARAARRTAKAERFTQEQAAKAAKEAGIASEIAVKETKAKRPVVTVTEATGEQAAEFLRMGAGDLIIEGKILDINFDRLDTADSVKEALAKVSKLFRERIDESRRGVRSREETARAAEAMGMTVEDLLSRRAGQAMNAEEALATRQLLVASARQLREMAARVRTGDAEVVQPFLKQFALHAEIQAQAAGVRAEAGRSLNIFGVSASGEVEQLSALGRVIENIGSGTTAERLAQMIGDVPTPQQLALMARQASKPTAGDVFIEAWINGLLSGPQTQIVNVMGNSITTAWAIPERFIAGQFREGVQPGEATAMLFGLVNGFRDAMQLAGKSFKTGETAFGKGKVELRRPKSISADTFDAVGKPGRAVDMLGEAIRTPTKSLMAVDEFFKAINYRMELYAQSFRIASAEGVEGPEMARRIAEVLSDPPASVSQAAKDFATYQTFTNELGTIGKSIQQLADSHPWAKVVIPFVRTPINIFKFARDRTPLGLFAKSVRDDMAAGGVRADLAKAKMALGSMTMLATVSLSLEGRISGGGPSDPAARRALLDIGWKPYSFRIGNKWIQYNRLDPIGMVIGMAADFVEIGGELEEADLTEVAGAMILTTSRNMTSKTYARGVAEVMEVLAPRRWDSPETIGKRGGRFFERLIGTGIPAGAAQLARAVDPTLRNARGVLDEVRSRVPIVSKGGLPARNIYGEPIIRGGGWAPEWVNPGVAAFFSPIYQSEVKNDPVPNEVLSVGVRLSMPSRRLGPAGNSIELTNEEHDLFVRLAGNELKLGARRQGMKERLAEEFKKPGYLKQTDGPDGGKARIIRKIVQVYRDAARIALRDQLPDLDSRLREKEREQIEKLTPSRSFIPLGVGP